MISRSISSWHCLVLQMSAAVLERAAGWVPSGVIEKSCGIIWMADGAMFTPAATVLIRQGAELMKSGPARAASSSWQGHCISQCRVQALTLLGRSRAQVVGDLASALLLLAPSLSCFSNNWKRSGKKSGF